MNEDKYQASLLNQQGEDLFNKGDINAAVSVFTKAIEIDPELAILYNNLGVLYWQEGETQRAMDHFEKALEIDPDNEDASLNLQKVYNAQQENTIEGQELESTENQTEPNQSDDTVLIVKIKGGVDVCVPPSIKLLTPYILLEQEGWFEYEIDFIRKALQPGMKVIDIGASYGLYTLVISKAINTKGRIWAFEPTSSTAAFLRKSISKNHMTNIELIQAGLSDNKRMATIVLKPNSELNVITSQPEANAACETVQLLCLDDCEREYGWDAIDFIKLDAEGQEHNIIRGGKHFLSTKSPLIMYELKHVKNTNTQLINDFSGLGYNSYRLIPGLNLLVPVDFTKAFDQYQLNLFCCKDDRANQLEKMGFLVRHPLMGPPNIEDHLWQKWLASMPYSNTLIEYWISIKDNPHSPGWDHYQNALNYYMIAHSVTRPNASHYVSLQHALAEIIEAVDIYSNPSRLLTLSRIQSELGERQGSLDTLKLLLNMFKTEKNLNLAEPFLPVSSRFDFISPASDAARWCLNSVMEQFEKTKDYSSYFTGQASLKNLETLHGNGSQTPEMERRRQLIRIRFGLQNGPEPNPVLLKRTSENLNPELWQENSFSKLISG